MSPCFDETKLVQRPSGGATYTPPRFPAVNAIRSPVGAQAMRSTFRSVFTKNARWSFSPRTMTLRPVSVGWMNAMRVPSGDSAGFSSGVSCEANRFSVPSGERIQMRDAFPSPRANAIVPLGASEGELSGSLELVIRSGVPAVPSALTFIRQSAYWPERSEENTMVEQSWLQAGYRSHAM